MNVADEVLLVFVEAKYSTVNKFSFVQTPVSVFSSARSRSQEE